MKVSMKKMMGLFVLAVALVFLEGLLPEKRRKSSLPHSRRIKVVS